MRAEHRVWSGDCHATGTLTELRRTPFPGRLPSDPIETGQAGFGVREFGVCRGGDIGTVAGRNDRDVTVDKHVSVGSRAPGYELSL